MEKNAQRVGLKEEDQEVSEDVNLELLNEKPHAIG